jgi:predicted metal-dependent hydrolase
MSGAADGDAGERLARGVAQFNDAEFWNAHESWETIWLAARDPEKLFLQGLIQLAAAYHHVQRGTFRGGVRLFDAAFEKLSSFENGYRGIDREEVIRAAKVHREKIARGTAIGAGEYPKLRYNQSPLPPHGNVA